MPRSWWLYGKVGAIQSIATLKWRAELSCHLCSGQMVLMLEEILRKRDIFHQDKKWLWRGTWNGFICCSSMQKKWKEIIGINEERQGRGMITGMQLLVQEVPNRQVTKRQGRMGEEEERCHTRLTVFYILFFSPSLPSQDMILVTVEFLPEPEWHFLYSYIFQGLLWCINKQDSSTSINANYVQKQFVAEWWN